MTSYFTKDAVIHISHYSKIGGTVCHFFCYTVKMEYNIRKPLNEKEKAEFPALSPLLAQLLTARGIKNAKEAEKFLNPDYDRDTHDPFLLKDAEKAATRIIASIKGNATDDSGGANGQKIAIYADYDADGIPGAALFHDFFKRIGFKNFITYIPHRHNEGFGLNIDAVEQLAGTGVKLLITVDCGISDFEPVRRANDLGVEVIITDHHEAPEKLPPAFAIIDHKQKNCDYPDKNLCGTGVAYKLIQAILKKDRLGLPEGHEKWLLDLVGLATLSDMVPLSGENRVFAKYGLDVLRKSFRKGLRQLLDHLRISQTYLTEDDIAFMITPRINAASRMGVPMDAFNLLSADNDEDARRAAEHLDHINNERKGSVAALVKEVKKAVNERYGSGGHESGADKPGSNIPDAIVLGNPDWRPSLLGLVANTVAEEFDRPVFLWGRDGDNVIKGSCRSEGKSDVVEIMRAVPAGVLIQYGGHKNSGGFAVSDEAIHFLDKYLNEAAQTIKERTAQNKVANASITIHGTEGLGDSSGDYDSDGVIDAELSLDEVNWELWSEIDQLSPFGMGNRKPAFLFRDVVPISVRGFGKSGDHVELVFRQKSGAKLSAISFFGAGNDWAKILMKNGKSAAKEPDSIAKIDMIASLEKSMFRGQKELRLRVVEIFL